MNDRENATQRDDAHYGQQQQAPSTQDEAEIEQEAAAEASISSRKGFFEKLAKQEEEKAARTKDSAGMLVSAGLFFPTTGHLFLL